MANLKTLILNQKKFVITTIVLFSIALFIGFLSGYYYYYSNSYDLEHISFLGKERYTEVQGIESEFSITYYFKDGTTLTRSGTNDRTIYKH